MKQDKSTCSNGATCDMTCTKKNCALDCVSGASCKLDCGAYSQAQCNISQCHSGTPMLCPDNKTWVCNASC